MALVIPELDSEGVEPVMLESEIWDCEAEPDAPGALEVPVAVPVTPVEFSFPPEVEAVGCPVPVLPWDSPADMDVPSL